MSEHPVGGVPSKAAIAGHPIHPMLIPLPIGFLIGALLADIGYAASGDVFWARGAAWLTGAGLVGGLLAAIFGLVDFLSLPAVRSHKIAWIHAIGNGGAMVLALVSLLIRLADVGAAAGWGLVLSIAIVAILGVTGWLGGELSYRHGIGVVGPDRTASGVRPRS